MRRICFIILCLVLVACGLSPEQQVATQTAVAATVIAQITFNAPTATSTATKTATPDYTPTPKSTQTPKPTPTPVPGIGDSVKCGRLWQIDAISPPSFSDILISEPPKGAYAAVYFLFTNLQDHTDSLNFFGDELALVGDLQGRTVSFEATDWGPSYGEQAQGIVGWIEDIPPSIQVTTLAIFDVNPNVTNWRLRLTVDPTSGQGCTAEIALYETK